MKRFRTILLFLLLGAVVNVAVAWGITLTVTKENLTGTGVNTVYYSNSGVWRLLRYKAFGSEFYVSNHDKHLINDEELLVLQQNNSKPLPETSEPHWVSMATTTDLFQRLTGSPLPVSENRQYQSRGWPLASLWCQPEFYVGDGLFFEVYESRGLIAIPRRSDDVWGPEGLPLFPIWPGFIFNTLFYAAALWLLFPGSVSLRRIFRRKRGLCVKCKYDLRGAEHQSCPECGKPI